MRQAESHSLRNPVFEGAVSQVTGQMQKQPRGTKRVPNNSDAFSLCLTPLCPERDCPFPARRFGSQLVRNSLLPVFSLFILRKFES